MTLSTPLAGASIRYTLDGTDPGVATVLPYAGPVRIGTSCTLKAVTVSGNQCSRVATYEYVLEPLALEEPTATPPPGTYDSPIDVTLSSPPGTSIIFTLDGSQPTLDHGLIYAGSPIHVDGTLTIKAIAVQEDATSPVATFRYEIVQPSDEQELDPLTDADPNTAWLVRFNLPLDPSTISNESVYVADGSGRRPAQAVTPGEDPRTLLVEPPTGGYTPGASYVLKITTSVRAQSGATLRRPVRMAFTIKVAPTAEPSAATRRVIYRISP
ncbi:MAG TPA: hypothetical protein GXX50_02080 [Firmicutes bacterium]|nr:hypothetical protein [Bacillota bacterium]